MMYGTREPFTYLECTGCGCLYISAVPDDLGRHYPAEYYSLGPPSDRPLVRQAKRLRGRQAFGDRSLIGSLVTRVMGAPDYLRWTQLAGVDRTARILDIGAGGGHRVFNMTEAGFTDVSGVEPYLDVPIRALANGAVVRRDMPVDGPPFDLVMMHHAFEHVTDPHAQLRAIAAVLRPGGCVLLRMPVFGKAAWHRFGVDWVQLDPPRHLLLPTERSVDVLAEASGFAVETSYYDSTAFQFWGSEMYAADVPLQDAARYRKAHGYRRGSRKLLALDRQAQELNERREGDQAAFFLRHH